MLDLKFLEEILSAIGDFILRRSFCELGHFLEKGIYIFCVEYYMG
jgi:hypothetical protein